jgi:hypothetical protein
VREFVRQNLDGDIAFQLRVASPVHFTHSAFAESGCNLVLSQTGANRNVQIDPRKFPLVIQTIRVGRQSQGRTVRQAVSMAAEWSAEGRGLDDGVI